MYKRLGIAALVVGVVLLGGLGVKQATAPSVVEDHEPPSTAPRSPPSAVPSARTERRRRLIRFQRGPEEPSAPVTSVVVADHEVVPPPPGRRTLDELSEQQRREVRDVALERLSELVEACESSVPGPVQSMASIVLDDRGLHTMELAAYEGGAGEPVVMLEAPPPAALADCLEEELWAGDWAVMQPGESVAFELTMRFAAEGDEAEGDGE